MRVVRQKFLLSGGFLRTTRTRSVLRCSIIDVSVVAERIHSAFTEVIFVLAPTVGTWHLGLHREPRSSRSRRSFGLCYRVTVNGRR